jgi:hypothetical protein
MGNISNYFVLKYKRKLQVSSAGGNADVSVLHSISAELGAGCGIASSQLISRRLYNQCMPDRSVPCASQVILENIMCIRWFFLKNTKINHQYNQIPAVRNYIFCSAENSIASSIEDNTNFSRVFVINKKKNHKNLFDIKYKPIKMLKKFIFYCINMNYIKNKEAIHKNCADKFWFIESMYSQYYKFRWKEYFMTQAFTMHRR